MALLVCRQRATNVALVAATAQTLIQLVAPTNQRLKIRQLSISFNGTVNTAVPVLVQLMIQTTAGTASAGTPVKVDGDMQETIQASTQITFTVEPTYSSVIDENFVHPQTGIIVPYNLSTPPTLKGGTRIGVVATAQAGVNCSAILEWEE